MSRTRSTFSSWVAFGGAVLIVAALNWAEAILVPICLAALLTFVLTPPVMMLERRIGRITAVLAVVALVFTFLGLAGYGVYRQMIGMGETLPTYRANIRAKIRDVRFVRSNGSFERLERTFKQIQGDLGQPRAAQSAVSPPVVVEADRTAGFSAVGWLGPYVEPLGTAGFVVTLVIFMLLEREKLRDRLIGALGRGHLAVTTRALEEAGARVSRQLVLQTVVNVTYGTLVFGGLYLFGVPYALFWGAFGAVLRFIPYIGPLIAAGGPILLALAALPGWTGPLEVVGFFIVLELFTNLVLETVLYAGAAGISQVSLLIAVAFWTWLWGPLGLLMATPLTVCLVVMGKHVRGLEFVGMLIADRPALTVESTFYQRVLARDQAEASDLVERHLADAPLESLYDALLVPVLNFAERDRTEGRLSAEDEQTVVEVMKELLDTLPTAQAAGVGPQDSRIRVLGVPINGTPDALALRMLGQLLSDLPITFDILETRLMASELIPYLVQNRYAVLCVADLPPSPASKSRYLVKKVRSALPDMRIAVGRWAPPELADETGQPLLDAGASHTAASLRETRTYLAEAAHLGAPIAVAPDAA